MKLRFKDRIALFNTLAAAITTLLVFLVVYSVVFFTAYSHLDADILEEKEEVSNNLRQQGDSIVINQMPEWEEQEHQQVEVNPTFLQIIDKQGHLIFRSINLEKDHLLFDSTLVKEAFFNSFINDKRIRQGQFPIVNDNKKIIGYLSVGVSQEESALVLHNLRTTLFIAFPLLLLVMYLATSIAAAQGIAPVNELIKSASGIHANIDTRLPLPGRKDEIHQLATTINTLLNRIENSFLREKQFTADASHELRTPLAAIRGTLEVLIRRQRAPQQYEEKINQVIHEVDRMHQLLEQLLQLARLEAGSIAIKKEPIIIFSFLQKLQTVWQPHLDKKQVQLQIEVPVDAIITTDANLLDLILGNLIGNAIKYGPIGCTIRFHWNHKEAALSISDNGPGIPAEQFPYLFDRFYRADTSRTSKIPGSGLGLSIVKKLADLQHIRIAVTSHEGEGTTFTLFF